MARTLIIAALAALLLAGDAAQATAQNITIRKTADTVQTRASETAAWKDIETTAAAGTSWKNCWPLPTEPY